MVDKAHQLARWVGEPARSPAQKRFEALRTLVTDPRTGLLLLSATPTLHSDEAGFQALLHLLDPVVYPLGDLDGLPRTARHARDRRAAYHLFRPDEEGGYLETALDQLLDAFPKDARLKELGERPAAAARLREEADDPHRVDAVRRRPLARLRGVPATPPAAAQPPRRRPRGGPAPGPARARPLGLRRPRGRRRWSRLLDEWRKAAAAAVRRSRRSSAACSRCSPRRWPATPRCSRRLSACGSAKSRQRTAAHRRGPAPPDRAALPRRGEAPGRSFRDAAGDADATPRIDAVVAGLDRAFSLPKTQVTRTVVFASSAGRGRRRVRRRRRRWPGQVLGTGSRVAALPDVSPTFRVLVCDRAAEEGLNLHGRGTVLVHYDLPWSPNRVEQRDRPARPLWGRHARSLRRAGRRGRPARGGRGRLSGPRLPRRSSARCAALQYLTERNSRHSPGRLTGGVRGRRRAPPTGSPATRAWSKRAARDSGARRTGRGRGPAGARDFADELRASRRRAAADWQAACTRGSARRYSLPAGARAAPTPACGATSSAGRGEAARLTLMPLGRSSATSPTSSTPTTSAPRRTRPLTYPLTFDRVRARTSGWRWPASATRSSTSLVDYVGLGRPRRRARRCGAAGRRAAARSPPRSPSGSSSSSSARPTTRSQRCRRVAPCPRSAGRPTGCSHRS